MGGPGILLLPLVRHGGSCSSARAGRDDTLYAISILRVVLPGVPFVSATRASNSLVNSLWIYLSNYFKVHFVK